MLEPQIEEELKRFTIDPVFRDWALEKLSKMNDKEIVDRTKIHESVVTALGDTQRQLDNLTKMRYRDLIGDDEFLKERTDLQNELVKLQAQRNETEDRARNWLELSEKTFNFACYARKAFVLGGIQEKREILAALGKNFKLKDGKLSLEANSWFRPVVESYPGLHAEYEKVRTEDYGSKNSSYCCCK